MGGVGVAQGLCLTEKDVPESEELREQRRERDNEIWRRRIPGKGRSMQGPEARGALVS